MSSVFTIVDNVLDPHAYFVGGGVVEAAPHFPDWFLDTIREHTQPVDPYKRPWPSWESCPTETWTGPAVPRSLPLQRSQTGVSRSPSARAPDEKGPAESLSLPLSNA